MRKPSDPRTDIGMVKLGRSGLIPVGAALLTVVAVWLIGRQDTPVGFPLDDAWIHMVYGRGLLSDGVLAYNPGEAATGSTAPLWSVILALLHLGFSWISVDALVVSVFVVGALLHIACAYLVTQLVIVCGGDRRVALIAGVLCGASPALAAAAYSGMEVGLCALLIVMGVKDCAAGRLLRAGVWLALAAATRPEAAAVGLVCSVLVLLNRGGSSGGQGVTVRRRFASLWQLAVPAAVVAVVLTGYNLLASGRPLPATFYFKEASSLLDLPRRVSVGVGALLSQVPPLYGFAGWLALAGYAARPSILMMYPLLAGLGFLIANLFVAPPLDPGAFYHLRYLLPAVPLLIAALALGAELCGTWLDRRWRRAPQWALLAVGLMGTASTLSPIARHLHNDVRNVNEVQRRMGEWLLETVPPDSWIAASDAGAVRYFSQRATLDMMGLNTPELYWRSEVYPQIHPVVAMAVMEEWFEPVDGKQVRVLAEVETADYTVTSNHRMARQQILTCIGPVRQITRIEFEGLHSLDLFCQPLLVDSRTDP